MTVLPTTLDLINASKYAGYLYMVNSTREYFQNKNIILKEKNVEWEPELVAGLIKPSVLEPKIELSFDEKACKDINCFDWIKFRRCYADDKPQIVDDGVNKYEACQEACRKFKTQQNTVWKNGKCKLLNLGLKTFCIIPSTRSHTLGYFNKQPPFRWDEDKSDCYNNDAYCTHFGMRLQANGECDRSDFIKVFHFVFGDTITKQFANEVYYPSKKYRSGWEDVDEFPIGSSDVVLEKSPTKFIASQDHLILKADDEYYSGKNVSIRILKYLGESILVALGIEVALRITPALLSFISSYVSSIAFEEVLPSAIYVLGAGVATAFESLATNGLIVAVVGTVSTTVGTLLSVANPVLLVVGAASVAGFIIDQTLEDFTHTQTDLKNFISASNLHKICAQANDRYAYLAMGKQKFSELVDLDPIVMWSQNVVMDEKDPKRLKYIMFKSAHYLKNLKYNSIGQLINYDEDEEKVQKLNVIPEPYEEKIPTEVTSYLFDTPSKSKYILWGTLITIFVGSAYTFTFFYYPILMMFLLLSFIFFCYDLITWWTTNSTYSGNILYIYDKFFKE